MTKTQQISLAILTKINAGMSVKDAINAVLGEGTFEQIASDIWEAAQ
jgi:hypothetical protein